MSRKKKRLKELTDADIAACEPESIWLETRKCPVPAHSVMWVIVLLLVLGISFSAATGGGSSSLREVTFDEYYTDQEVPEDTKE